MQQTNKHKFNLIETGDTFSPDPLNENMEKVESALAAVYTTMGTGGQTCRIACGSFTGNGSTQTLTFDFYPLAVLLATKTTTGTSTALLVRGCSSSTGGAGGSISSVEWKENGLSYSSIMSNEYNKSDMPVWYVVIGTAS